MEVQNDTIFCFTGPSCDASWILPAAVDLYLVISVLSLIKTFYYEKAEIQLFLRNSASPTRIFIWHGILLSSPTFFLSDAPLSLSLQGNDPLSHAAHIFEFIAKDTYSQSTGCEALLLENLLKNISEERGEGEETHLPV